MRLGDVFGDEESLGVGVLSGVWLGVSGFGQESVMPGHDRGWRRAGFWGGLRVPSGGLPYLSGEGLSLLSLLTV